LSFDSSHSLVLHLSHIVSPACFRSCVSVCFHCSWNHCLASSHSPCLSSPCAANAPHSISHPHEEQRTNQTSQRPNQIMKPIHTETLHYTIVRQSISAQRQNYSLTKKPREGGSVLEFFSAKSMSNLYIGGLRKFRAHQLCTLRSHCMHGRS
jgi:hypothetical protein